MGGTPLPRRSGMAHHMPAPAKGVRQRPDGTWQVRIAPFPDQGGFLTVEDANDYAADLRRRKRQGILVPPPSPTLKLTPLKELAEDYLADLATFGGRRERPYSPSGLEKARQACRPWLGVPVTPYSAQGGYVMPPEPRDAHGRLFGDLPLAGLDPRDVERYLAARRVETPRAAEGEAQVFQGILELASRRSEQFDHSLFRIRTPKRRPRVQPGIAPADLDYLIPHVIVHQQDIFRLGKTLGPRIMELLMAEDAWVDFDAGTLTIPARFTREHRRKVIDLLPEELAILRGRRLARHPKTVNGEGGTPLLFPRKLGSAWTSSAFWEDVIKPARRKAAAKWREDHNLAADADTPFAYVATRKDTGEVITVNGEPRWVGFGPHDLRRCAASTLRAMGVP